MKWTEEKDVIITNQNGRGVGVPMETWLKRERECMVCSGEKPKLPERNQC